MNTADYINFYKDILGFEPYDYQVKVAELLLSGKNLILSVPTGSGKTWASVMPFLYAIHKGVESFPQKTIYSLPLRTLTNSIYSDIRDILNNDRIEFNYPSLKELASVQTGEFNNDTMFEKNLVFSTIDQTLSSFLCFPLGLSHNQANINAGALVGSYLIFDEFHLLDSKLSMSTSLGMLRMLKNMYRVCIMTATLSDSFLRFMKNEFDPQNQFNFEVVTLADFPEDRKKIKSVKPAPTRQFKKSVFVSDNTLNAEAIIEKHKNKTIVICNRVESAQNIFTELCKIKNGNTNVFCIHSRFFDSDRKQKEQLIKHYFGKKSTEKDVILVATQVIEAGMDISCDVMHTEISPINSFLQRAGRCARFENEYGEVFVYDVLSMEEKDLITDSEQNEEDKNEIKKLNSKYLPYDKDLCCKTLSELKKINFLDDKISENLVNTILTENETEMIRRMCANTFNSDKIKASWRDCDKKHYRNTIRDIQSVDLVLVNMDNSTEFEIVPWQYETISVYRWSFIGWAKKIVENRISEDDWIFAKAVQSGDSQFDFDWDDENKFMLKQLDIDEMKNYYDIIFVDNRYFDYSPEVGLTVKQNCNNISSPLKEKRNCGNEDFSYRKDTLYEHSQGLIKCFEKDFKHNCVFIFNNLSAFWGENYDWESLLKLILCYHDFGKLNQLWQDTMLNYQRRKNNDASYYEVLAHSDYDANIDKQLGEECKIKQKPPHAGIGAMRIYDIIFDKYAENEELARAISNAILKHHSVDTHSYCSFEIKSSVINEFNKLLTALKIDNEPTTNRKERGDNLDECEKVKEWIVYFVMVRLLRLCDQRATENLEKYYER